MVTIVVKMGFVCGAIPSGNDYQVDNCWKYIQNEVYKCVCRHNGDHVPGYEERNFPQWNSNVELRYAFNDINDVYRFEKELRETIAIEQRSKEYGSKDGEYKNVQMTYGGQISTNQYTFNKNPECKEGDPEWVIPAFIVETYRWF
jgi:hypothetical protein